MKLSIFSFFKNSFLIIVFTLGISSCSKDDTPKPSTVPTVTSIKSINSEIPESEGVIIGMQSLEYTGGNGLDYPDGQIIESKGLTGYTLKLLAGKLSNGAGGTLKFELKGNTIANGIASFDISFGGQTAKLSYQVTLQAKIENFYCNTAKFSAEPKANTPFTGQVSIDYSGSNGGAFHTYSKGGETSSKGVTGLKLKIKTGPDQVIFLDQEGSIVYDITGTPSSKGTASFDIYLGGKSCTISTPVNP